MEYFNDNGCFPRLLVVSRVAIYRSDPSASTRMFSKRHGTIHNRSRVFSLFTAEGKQRKQLFERITISYNNIGTTRTVCFYRFDIRSKEPSELLSSTFPDDPYLFAR